MAEMASEAVSAVSHMASKSVANRCVPRNAGIRLGHLVSIVERLEPSSTE
jgi:hypothetical protein